MNTTVGKIIAVNGIRPTDTIEKLKAKIQEIEGIPPFEQCLVFGSKPLSDLKKTLVDYKIQNESTI